MSNKIQVRFAHGLGDCCYFAHMIPLYTKRGYSVEVQCEPNEAILFQVAGAKTFPGENTWPKVSWEHAPKDDKNLDRPWHSNKAAFNICRSPMPDIGTPEQLWEEFCNIRLSLASYISTEIRQGINQLTYDLPKPLILVHTQGNSFQSSKNLPSSVAEDLYRGLITYTNGTIIQLDWDNREPSFPSGRIRHTQRDWNKRLSVLELHRLIQVSDLLIGVDSGPLHFTRFTHTPSVGAWVGHHPSDYALPREQSIHLVTKEDKRTPYRRLDYNIVGPKSLNGYSIADQAIKLLSPRKCLEDSAKDIVFRSLLDKCIFPSNGSYSDRHKGFEILFNHLKKIHVPAVLETGCIRAEEDWSAGYSTYLFSTFLTSHRGFVDSIDNNLSHIEFARKKCNSDVVTFHYSDSVEWLTLNKASGYDLAYLDSADVGTEGYREICLHEAVNVLPLMEKGGLVAIDDSPWKDGKVTGKGGLAAPYLLSKGWKVLYHGHQIILTRE